MSKFLMQAVSSGIGGDGTLKRWNAATLDFGGSGFPGPGTATHVACSKQIRDDVLVTAGNGTARGNHVEWNGSIWVQKFNWITADVDLSGAVDSDSYLRSDLAAAAARPGSCLYVPPGRVKLQHGSKISIPASVTLCGSPQGMRSGPFQVGGYANVGTQFEIPALNNVAGGTARGDLFELGVQSRVADCGFYYPHQNLNSAPVAYGWAILMPNIGCHVENVFGVNPYQFIKNTGGGKINSCWGYPLLTGVQLGRVADSMVVTECRWNPTSIAALGTSTTLQAWVAANAKAFGVDGAESFMFSGCFAFGYQTGISFHDDDADGFHGSSGSWHGGGFDGTTWGVHVNTTSALSSGGFAMFGATLTTIAGGVGVLFTDTHVPGSDLDRPNVYLHGCHGNAPPNPNGMGRFVWISSGSYGQCLAQGGMAMNVLNEVARNDSATGTLVLHDVGSQSGTTRTAGRVEDRHGRYLDKPGVVLSGDGATNGALLTDADATITVDLGAHRVIPANTLTANRTIDIDNGVAVDNERITIDRLDASNKTVTIRDNANATIGTFPASLPMTGIFRKAAGGNFVCIGMNRRQP